MIKKLRITLKSIQKRKETIPELIKNEMKKEITGVPTNRKS